MIAYIEGRIVALTENACIVVTPGGVGYEIFLTVPARSRVSAKDCEAAFFTCTVVREDALELYGFETWDERTTFIVLTSITRVGSRTAMAILSVFSPDELRRIVADDDTVSLTRVSGIGKKTGQQIFLELKYKFKDEASVTPSGDGEKGGSVLTDAVAGLMNLGYDTEEALKVVKGILTDKPDLDVGGVLRASLKALGGRCL